jgi:hypothetical protein
MLVAYNFPDQPSSLLLIRVSQSWRRPLLLMAMHAGVPRCLASSQVSRLSTVAVPMRQSRYTSHFAAFRIPRNLNWCTCSAFSEPIPHWHVGAICRHCLLRGGRTLLMHVPCVRMKGESLLLACAGMYGSAAMWDASLCAPLPACSAPCRQHSICSA